MKYGPLQYHSVLTRNVFTSKIFNGRSFEHIFNENGKNAWWYLAKLGLKKNWRKKAANLFMITLSYSSILLFFFKGDNINEDDFLKIIADLTTSVPVDSLEDLEDLDEEVDDVQVELNGGGDVLLRGDPGHDHLQTRQMVKG
jgi:hypothetical protein